MKQRVYMYYDKKLRRNIKFLKYLAVLHLFFLYPSPKVVSKSHDAAFLAHF